MHFAHAFCKKTFGTEDYEHPMGVIDYGIYNIIAQEKFGAEFDSQRLWLIAELSDHFSAVVAVNLIDTKDSEC